VGKWRDNGGLPKMENTCFINLKIGMKYSGGFPYSTVWVSHFSFLGLFCNQTMDHTIIFAKWWSYVPPSNTWFLGPIRVSPLPPPKKKGISISSAIFAEFAIMNNTQQQRQTMLHLNRCSNSPNVALVIATLTKTGKIFTSTISRRV